MLRPSEHLSIPVKDDVALKTELLETDRKVNATASTYY